MTDEFRFCPTCGTDTSSSGSDAPTEVMPDSTLLLLLRRVVGDRYEIHHLLGRGGMGAVFKATDVKLQRTVAIKVLPPEYATEQRVRDRFLREAQSAARLDHPNVVSIYVVEDDPELHYFIMKFVEGKPLDQILERGKLPWQEVQHIVFEAAQGLAHAHRRGVVHRDVKPANIVLDAEGHALLADFGISKVQSANTTFTPTGAIVGTPAYLSPEQAKTEEADGRSDQYSLGMVAYRMLAGKPAFAGDSAHTLIYKHIFADVPPLQDECPDAPEFLVAAIHRALSKSPDDRFTTMDDFANALFPGESQPTPLRRTRATAPSPRETVATTGTETTRIKLKWTALLLGVFAFNYAQTSIEACCQSVATQARGFEVAAALHYIERGFQFANHDLTNMLAVYGYSLSYFFLLPALALLVGYFAWRDSVRAYRGLVVAVALTYFISLPFFLFFPVPERWAYPDSGAILLSDLWSSGLIEAIRPISALDNSFPSFHTSLSVVISATAFAYRLPLWRMTSFLSGTIILATIALGIHWIPDLIAGFALGILAVALGLRLQSRFG